MRLFACPGVASLREAFQQADTKGDNLVDMEEFSAWWTSVHAMQRMFNSIDADNSGYVDDGLCHRRHRCRKLTHHVNLRSIDLYELASMLRRWRVTFTTKQFNTAMRQLTHRKVSEPEAPISLREFMTWWHEFSSFGAQRLLAINFDARVLSVLKEVRCVRGSCRHVSW